MPGHIVISDIEKPTAKEAIAALKKSGVTKTVMLTGDAQAAWPSRWPAIWAWTRCTASCCPAIRWTR